MVISQHRNQLLGRNQYWCGSFDLEPYRPWMLWALASDRGLLRVTFRKQRSSGAWPPSFKDAALGFGEGTDLVEGGSVIEQFFAEMERYVQGRLRRFETSLDLERSGTPFQRRVWEELQRIPYGKTISYGELAARVDCPGGSRAVGNANGRNPLAVIVPCHRVVAADGGLGGYTGGLDIKRFLLDVEGVGSPTP